MNELGKILGIINDLGVKYCSNTDRHDELCSGLIIEREKSLMKSLTLVEREYVMEKVLMRIISDSISAMGLGMRSENVYDEITDRIYPLNPVGGGR